MSNTFLSAKQIARQALPILRDNLVFPALSYVEYSSEFSRKGDTIQIAKPPVYTADEFNGNIKKQSIEESAVMVTLDKIADVSIEIGAKEMALDIRDFNSQVLHPAIYAIAQKINMDGIALYKDIPYHCGQALHTPDSLDIFADSTKILNKNNAPLSPRFALWDYEALSKLQVIPAIINAEKSASTTALREGAIGRVLGVDNYMSQAVCKHSSGVTGSATAKTKAVTGDTNLEITLTGQGTHVLKGDLIEIGGTSYTITQDAPITNKDANISIYPALVADVPANAAVTLIGDHTANLAFHKNAFAFVTRPLEPAKGTESYVVNFEGITLRVTLDYDINTKRQILSVDTLYGFKTLYPELACRILG